MLGKKKLCYFSSHVRCPGLSLDVAGIGELFGWAKTYLHPVLELKKLALERPSIFHKSMSNITHSAIAKCPACVLHTLQRHMYNVAQLTLKHSFLCFVCCRPPCAVLCNCLMQTPVRCIYSVQKVQSCMSVARTRVLALCILFFAGVPCVSSQHWQ